MAKNTENEETIMDYEIRQRIVKEAICSDPIYFTPTFLEEIKKDSRRRRLAEEWGLLPPDNRQ